MEAAFDHGFGDVRLHAGEDAARMSREIHADAFTVGSDVFVDASRHAPQSPVGRMILSHELAHVVQQSHVINRDSDRLGRLRDDHLEGEAAVAARRAFQGFPTRVTSRVAALGIQAQDTGALGSLARGESLTSELEEIERRRGHPEAPPYEFGPGPQAEAERAAMLEAFQATVSGEAARRRQAIVRAADAPEVSERAARLYGVAAGVWQTFDHDLITGPDVANVRLSLEVREGMAAVFASDAVALTAHFYQNQELSRLAFLIMQMIYPPTAAVEESMDAAIEALRHPLVDRSYLEAFVVAFRQAQDAAVAHIQRKRQEYDENIINRALQRIAERAGPVGRLFGPIVKAIGSTIERERIEAQREAGEALAEAVTRERTFEFRCPESPDRDHQVMIPMMTDTLNPTNAGMAALVELGAMLARDPSVTHLPGAVEGALVFSVKGYASRLGPEDHNWWLSERRAKRVEAILEQRIPILLRERHLDINTRWIAVAPPTWYGEEEGRELGLSELNDEERYRRVLVSFWAYSQVRA